MKQSAYFFNSESPASPFSKVRARRVSRCILLLLTVMFPTLTAFAGAGGTPTMLPMPGRNVAEQYLLNAANRDRATLGLQPLRFDATLAQAARSHAQQMADHADISHQFTGEPDLMQRGSQAGVRFSLISENVAESSDASIVHSLWMKSPGHRKNLLDPEVNSIGISVVSRGGRFYAVEDFAATIESLSYEDQEAAVSEVLARTGLTVGSSNITSTVDEARRTCNMDSGYSGRVNKPWYIVRYNADRLDQLPSVLIRRIQTGKYHKAVVGACQDNASGAFSDYNIAVLLYP